jgi:hypothetical protein
MSLIPAMFQYIRKMVGANDEKQVAFAPLATPFTNEDFLFMNSEIYQKNPAKFYAEALEFSQKANSIIKKANIWEIDSKDFLYIKFNEILNNARLIENRDYTDAERANQDKARKILYEADNTPTAAYKFYKVFENQFKEINRKSDAHKNSKPVEPQSAVDAWNATLNEYENELQDKELEWNALGHKAEVETAIKAFSKPRDNIDREIFAAKWQEAKNFMNTINTSSIIGGSAIFPMECIPNNLYQYKGTIWSKITLSGEEITTLTNDLKQAVGDVDIAMIFGEAPIELDKVSFEICRVILSRSWFNENILISRFWDYPGVTVSTGVKDNFEGEVPAYPIEFVLVKNVDFTLSSNSAVNDIIKNNLKTGLPILMGPFFLKSSSAPEAQNHPVRVQTFTNSQLKVMATTVNKDAIKPAEELSKKRGLQMLHEFVVRDHRTSSGAPAPPVRAGYVWVEGTPAVPGHWERERAVKVEPVKVSGKIVDENDQAISDAEVTILNTSTPVSQNDLTDMNGFFIIENVLRSTYHLTVKKEGYSVIEKEISLSGDTDLGKMNLSSNNPVESFLLLGVVYKKLPALPNPIPNEVYA